MPFLKKTKHKPAPPSSSLHSLKITTTMNPPSENPRSLGLLSICGHRCLHPRDEESNWMATLKTACKSFPASGPHNWDVAKTGQCLLKRSRGRLSYTLLAEGALVFSCLQDCTLNTFLALIPSWCSHQGWVLTNKLFIELKGACSLIVLLNVLYLILFILPAA